MLLRQELKRFLLDGSSTEIIMMMPNSPLLVLFALVAVPLSTISTKTSDDLMQDGDKAKQSKVLELLDQYVSHVDKGRSEDQVLDLLDQYVMHVDRGADLSLEEFEKRKVPSSSHDGWSRNMGQNGVARGQRVGKSERTAGDKVRRIDRVKRHLRGVQRTGEGGLVRIRGRMSSRRARRSVEKSDRRDTEKDVRGGGIWTHSVNLHPTVTLSWRILNDSDVIEFLVEAETRGYVGVGFSPGGGMAGADIVLGWVDDSNGRIYVVVSKLLP